MLARSRNERPRGLEICGGLHRIHAVHGMKTRLDEGVLAYPPSAHLGYILDVVVVLGFRLGVGHLFVRESLKNTGKSTIPRQEFALRPVALFIR